MRLEAAEGAFHASVTGGALNAPCAAWHVSFAAACEAAGLGVIWSLSYELFDAYCPEDWKQRASDGRSEEQTSELQSLMRRSYAVFCLQKKNTTKMSINQIAY